MKLQIKYERGTTGEYVGNPWHWRVLASRPDEEGGTIRASGCEKTRTRAVNAGEHALRKLEAADWTDVDV